ncbi:MAG: hypothetical protein IJZ23_10175 [Roseburia sp.]|nr:hypothetical protein [Roseburia sp.]
MKKNVIYIFSLILYLLIACTIVSQKIELEMCTQVEVSERRYTGRGGGTFSSSTDVLFEDEEGQHLYEIVEGSGWKSGQRIGEISTSIWSGDGYGKLSIPNGRSYTLVESASRAPEEGAAVLIVEVPGRTRFYVPLSDRYLVCYPDGVPEEFVLPENSSVISKSDTAVLLDMSDIIYPFFEHRAKKLSISFEGDDCRIFSMTEIESFLEQLPKVAVLGVYLFLPVFIWMCSGMLIKESAKYRELLLLNAGMVVIFLLTTMGVLEQIDFPASLLPVDSIFDVSYYVQEFSLIREAQSSLKEPSQTVAMLLPEVKKVVACIIGVGMLAGIALCVGELFLVSRVRNSKKKSANCTKVGL